MSKAKEGYLKSVDEVDHTSACTVCVKNSGAIPLLLLPKP